MRTTKTAKPFRVNAQWIEYAHGPGADDGQPTATELVDLPEQSGAVLIAAHRADLVREVLSVAELYASDSSVQDDDRLWFRLYPNKLTKRARLWLRDVKA
jgi:hypothetical protein